MLKFTFKSRGHFEESIVAIFSDGLIKNGISAWTCPKVSSSISIPLDFLLFFFFANGKDSKTKMFILYYQLKVKPKLTSYLYNIIINQIK
jgi:hypothetical protein